MIVLADEDEMTLPVHSRLDRLDLDVVDADGVHEVRVGRDPRQRGRGARRLGGLDHGGREGGVLAKDHRAGGLVGAPSSGPHRLHAHPVDHGDVVSLKTSFNANKMIPHVHGCLKGLEVISYLHSGSQLLPILGGRWLNRCLNVSVHYHLEALNLR